MKLSVQAFNVRFGSYCDIGLTHANVRFGVNVRYCYGPYTACDNRFNRWREAGIRDDVLSVLADADEAPVQTPDTTIVRVHQHGSCTKRTAKHQYRAFTRRSDNEDPCRG